MKLSDNGLNNYDNNPNYSDNKSWGKISASENAKVILATDAQRLYLSLDGGVTWSEKQPAGSFKRSWYALSISADGTKMLAGISGRKTLSFFR